MKEKIVITRSQVVTVSRCMDCPYFVPHPQEASCSAIDTSRDAYASLVTSWIISPSCPFRK